MSWAGQGVFALPCGVSAQLYGATLTEDAGTESPSFVPIPELEINLTIGFRRLATILLMGSVSNDTGGQLCGFSAQVDGAPVVEICDVLIPTDDAIQSVSLNSQVILEPGARVIQATWRSSGSGHINAVADRLHLQVILGQAVP